MKNRLAPVECLLKGERFALTRADLHRMTGYCDSYIRSHIGKQRETEVILNRWDGDGYYKPTEQDEAAVLDFYMKEHAAAVTRLYRLKTARKWLELHSNYTFQDYAPKLNIFAVPAEEKVYIIRDGELQEVTE